MSTITCRLGGYAFAAVAVTLLVTGCGGGASRPAAGVTSPQPTTTNPTAANPTATPSPTRTGPGPMTAVELAWLDGVKKMHAKVDSVLRRTPAPTRTTMLSLSNTPVECRRVLRRIGSPAARMRPVLALVRQACAQFDKAAAGWATAASVSDPGGGFVVGTPQERIYKQAVSCAEAGYGDGSNALGDAEVKGAQVKLAAG